MISAYGALAVRQPSTGRRASARSACFSVSWNGSSLVLPALRRYFGAVSTGAFSHLATVLRDNPVSLAISRSDFLPRLCSRRIRPIMSMVINPRTPLHKSAAGWVKHLLSFGAERPSKVAQFSVGANRSEFNRRRHPTGNELKRAFHIALPAVERH